MFIVGLPYKTKYVEVPREKRFERLYSYILIKIDLKKATEYLDISIQTEDTTIKEGLFKIALILYIKCFNNSGGGRIQLPLKKVYKDIPGEPVECYNKLKKIRDKFIAHDEGDFNEAKLGMVLNENEECIVGIACPEVQSKFDYDETIGILRTLCKVALKANNSFIDKELSIAESYLCQRDFKHVSEYPEMTIVNTQI
ncbi:MAG TPA: hypothetical protein PKA54_10335 [Chitinophagaceae bacterium]|nr:hypothetical protein [Chitinophagaceae bacterium]